MWGGTQLSAFKIPETRLRNRFYVPLTVFFATVVQLKTVYLFIIYLFHFTCERKRSFVPNSALIKNLFAPEVICTETSKWCNPCFLES